MTGEEAIKYLSEEQKKTEEVVALIERDFKVSESVWHTEYEAFALAIAALMEQEASQKALKAACNTLEQYINAEREGRMIVLPCKVGDIVYGAETEPVIPLYVVEHAVYLESAESGDFEVVSNFGKTVFLTREEAEQSLRRLGEV